MRSWSITIAIVGLAGLTPASVWARQAQTQPAAPPTPPASQAAPASPSPVAAPAAFDPSKSDEKAVAIAEQVMTAMGGDAWARSRYIRFTWGWKQADKSTAITHYWDRFAQRSRMEGPTKDGRKLVAIVDHQTKQGVASADGQPMSPEETAKYTKIAYDRLINDAYWVFMPFKLKDPGVRLRYDGEIKAGPITYDKIQLSFDPGVGNTSKDRYWLYVNRGNHMIERWSYVLESMASNAAPVAWEWGDWKDVGGMKLAMKRTQPGGESEIFVENVEVFETWPETVFTSTAPVELGPAARQASGQ